MCGIAGYIVKDGYRRENLREISDRYRKLLRHRGPDSDGEFIDEKGGILLSHTRLSIIDLSDASSQPFYSEDKNLVLIYNGEIYNFREIRDELSKKGYRFNTDGDTEVILRAYEEFGEDAFSRFIGMFAFALLDRRKSLLFLARDMTGIKPLYYFYDEKRLIFSSEMRPFSDFEENIDWRIYFLAFGYLPNPITTKKGVYALRKGHFLKLDLTSFYLSSSNFAKINFETDYNITEIEAINTTRELFKKAVERHLISDAPLGVFLSGGIDSSLISIVASKIREGQLTTLSVQFKEAEYTEERYQNLIAEKIHSNHWAHLFSLQDFMESIEDIKEAMDQPSIDGINTYFVSRMAKEAGCKTVLSGLGGDELFMGYGSFGLIDRLNHIRNIGIPFRGMIQKAGWMFNNERYRKLALLGLNNPIFFYLLFRALFIPKDIERLTGVKRNVIIEKIEDLYHNHTTKDLKNWLSKMEFDFYLLGQLLKDTDCMSMWHSVETRVPFLDNELVDFVSRVPSKIKYNQKRPKYLITEAYREVLPNEIVFREKMGFVFPFDKWVREKINLFEDMIYKDESGSFVKALIDRFKRKETNYSRLWALIVMNFKRW